MRESRIKEEARAYAKKHGVSYTEARRRVIAAHEQAAGGGGTSDGADAKTAAPAPEVWWSSFVPHKSETLLTRIRVDAISLEFSSVHLDEDPDYEGAGKKDLRRAGLLDTRVGQAMRRRKDPADATFFDPWRFIVPSNIGHLILARDGTPEQIAESKRLWALAEDILRKDLGEAWEEAEQYGDWDEEHPSEIYRDWLGAPGRLKLAQLVPASIAGWWAYASDLLGMYQFVDEDGRETWFEQRTWSGDVEVEDLVKAWRAYRTGIWIGMHRMRAAGSTNTTAGWGSLNNRDFCRCLLACAEIEMYAGLWDQARESAAMLLGFGGTRMEREAGGISFTIAHRQRLLAQGLGPDEQCGDWDCGCTSKYWDDPWYPERDLARRVGERIAKLLAR